MTTSCSSHAMQYNTIEAVSGMKGMKREASAISPLTCLIDVQNKDNNRYFDLT